MSEQSKELGGRAQVFRYIFERAGVGIVLVDVDGCIIECNDAFCAMLGYRVDELRQKAIFGFIHPEEREAELAAFRESLAVPVRERRTEGERRYLHQDGRIVWGRRNASIIFDAKGQPVFGMAIVEDITERRQAEAALRESEERYRLLFSEMIDGFALHEIICDPAGRPIDYRFLEVNPAFERLTGLRRQAVIGKTAREVMPGIESFWIDRYGAVAQTGMPMRFDGFSKELNKQFEVIAYSPTAGQFATTFTDVTERKAAEAELSAEKERLAVTLRSIGDGVIATDAGGKVLLLNRLAESLTGWTQEEAAGRQLWDVFRISPDSEHSQREIFDETIAGKTAMEFIEPLELRGRDGRQWIVGATSSAIRNRESAVVGVVIAFHDITEKQKHEEEQMRAEKLESLGSLAGGIAHDFNNILTAVLGNISLATARLGPANRELSSLLREAEQASLRARDLTQQLLTFAKGGTPIKEASHLAGLVKEAAEFAVRGSRSRVKIVQSSDLWPAEVDPGQVSQVIRNLVINADQAMPEGGTIVVRSENVVIDESQAVPVAPGRYVRISIADTGVGIPEDLRDKVFDPYFTTKQTGSGLGLATSRSIVKKHGGTITLRSAVGVGTTVDIYLPSAVEPSGAAPVAKTQARPVPAQARILVMDDEPAIRQLAARILAGVHFEVQTAADGAEALRLYTAALKAGQPFHVVILDLTVQGGMGGREALGKLREIDPSVSAIVSSGYSTDPVMSVYAEFGFKGVVAKPYRMETLVRAVRKVLEEKG